MSDDNSDVVVVAKKITKKFIPWDDDLALEVLVNAFQKKPYAAQKKTTAYEIMVAQLSNTGAFIGFTLTGANSKSKVDKCVAQYVGTYLDQGSNLSGFSGDRDDPENYTPIMLMAKKIYEEIEALEDSKKIDGEILKKQKCSLESSVLGFANR
jgi:hypothetical protein